MPRRSSNGAGSSLAHEFSWLSLLARAGRRLPLHFCKASLRALSFSVLSTLVVGSVCASTDSGLLPRPDHQKQLLRVNGFQLKRAQFAPETRVVVFFYSASWCAPCKQVAAQLQEIYT